ncbi:MAG: hypothetical protein KAR84_07615 [Elusimicrobiales bacterium]|nr:hypothetical protein [Elusimicrobiales bacterium]
MRLIYSLLVLFIFSLNLSAYRYDKALSKKLKDDFSVVIQKTETGKHFYERFEKIGAEFPEILIRKDKPSRLGYYVMEENKIYFNSSYITEFFTAEKHNDPKIIEILYKRKDAREEFVKFADALYLHELVHALQTKLYPNYRRDIPQGNMIEFEYEAFFTEDMYFHEKMKNNRKLMKDFLDLNYTDPYLSHNMSGYLNLSLDIDRYRENIKKMYKEGEGDYLSMSEAEEIQKSKLKESKIIAYASGNVSPYIKKTTGLAIIQEQKEEYKRFMDNFYKEFWPDFSFEVLMYIGEVALEVENYPLALECLAANEETCKENKVSKEDFQKLKTKGAVAILEATGFILDNSEDMDIEILSDHIKALDEACQKTGRPFPKKLKRLREKTYKKAIKHYFARMDEEKDLGNIKRYKENIDFFINLK